MSKKSITLLIASQKISTVASCDRIIVMNNGVIENIGTHEELLKKSYIYKEIYQMQK